MIKEIVRERGRRQENRGRKTRPEQLAEAITSVMNVAAAHRQAMEERRVRDRDDKPKGDLPGQVVIDAEFEKD